MVYGDGRSRPFVDDGESAPTEVSANARLGCERGEQFRSRGQVIKEDELEFEGVCHVKPPGPACPA